MALRIGQPDLALIGTGIEEAETVLFRQAELIRISEEAKLPAQISHVKLGSVAVWGKTPELIRLMESARRRGLDITADCYPYDAWSSTITVLVADTFQQPLELSSGIEKGWVNGQLVWHEGRATGAHPGVVLVRQTLASKSRKQLK